LLVVDDPAMAKAIEQLWGEWRAQTGGQFRVQTISAEEMAAGVPAADAVICPSGHLGPFADRGVAPLPVELVGEGQPHWSDVFSLLRTRQAKWRNQVVGVPFGAPVLTIYYREDLLEELGRQPPESWAGYLELTRLLSDRANLGDLKPPEGSPWFGAVEPLSDGSAGVVLLARAAPYATHRENYSTLFDIDTMEPLVGGPPFVRALEELVAASAFGPPQQLTFDPTAARNAFWRGECGLALSWPTAAEPVAEVGEGVRVAFAELPGAAEAYDIVEKSWEARREEEDPRVPLLGAAGAVGLVPSDSQWPDAAFQLLVWLSGEQSRYVSPASPATTLFRSSQIATPRVWVESPTSAGAAARYAKVVERALSRPQCMFAPRIPGRREYLAALDQAVHRAVRGEQSPQASLAEAAGTWREITERLGRELQRKAYWASLGVQ
jgi:multiple sugar transport system substrate-binding protein